MTTITTNEELLGRLREWWIQAGSPTYRGMAIEAGVSHTTIHDTFSGVRMPTWRTLQPIVETIGGDVEEARDLYAGTKPPARDPEVHAITQCTLLLGTLSEERRQRVMRFLAGKFGTGEDVTSPGV